MTIYESISAAASALNIQHSIITIYFKNNKQKPYKGRGDMFLKSYNYSS
jgi:hypothetical protein